jgi:periplasmic protein TonB
MKTIQILLLMLAAVLIMGPESNARETSKKDKPFVIVEQMPEYPGGVDSLMSYMFRNVNYPVDVKKAGVSGTVYISFVVDKTGHVEKAKVERGVSRSLNNEALRVVNAMPVWNPGKQGGKVVDVIYTIPIKFALK